MNLRLVEPPEEPPLALSEVKTHVRADLDLTDEDGLIQSLIVAATEIAEHRTGRALMPQTWELATDEFRSVISLEKAPILEIESVRYLDPNGVWQILEPGVYVLDDVSEPGRLVREEGRSSPATARVPNAVRVRFRAGYESAAAVPRSLKQWMLLHIGTLYENRETVVIGADVVDLPHLDGLLDPHKIWR